MTCSIPECGRKPHARGLCNMHYLRWRRHGDPEITLLHGHTSALGATATYRSWQSMVARCTNPKSTSYGNYGGRGVTVCERWRRFSAFLEDMGERPEGLSLDRIDNDGNYEPGNCRWATNHEQRVNQRSRPITHGTWAGYQRGCRCDECRGGMRRYFLERRKQRLANHQLDRDAASTTTRRDKHASDHGTNQPSPLRDGQHLPVRRRAHDQGGAEAA
jgi:hypothetical protein